VWDETPLDQTERTLAGFMGLPNDEQLLARRSVVARRLRTCHEHYAECRGHNVEAAVGKVQVLGISKAEVDVRRQLFCRFDDASANVNACNICSACLEKSCRPAGAGRDIEAFLASLRV
jgi:hypothetical protein